MIRTQFALMVVLVGVVQVSAQPAFVTIDDISPGSANPLLSGNNVGLDLFVSGLYGPPDMTGHHWAGGGVTGQASVGSFRYARDPNGGVVLSGTHDYDPGDQVTMFSKPRGQTDPQRFQTNGSGEISLFVGGFEPPSPTSTIADDTLNVAFATDPPGYSEINDGYISRVVLDLTGTGIDPLDVYAVSGTTPPGAGHILIATGLAVAFANNPPPLPRPLTWSLFAIPEPSTLGLLVIGGLCGFRRRR